jgi:hypothetical protein
VRPGAGAGAAPFPSRARRSRVALAGVALALLLAGPAAAGSASPHAYALSDSKVARWAAVLRRVVARKQPDARSPVVATLGTVTHEWTQNVVLVVEGIDVDASHTWYRVRLPVLPNNSTGWVPQSVLGDLHAVRTHLYVNRATFTATLKRGGRTIFTTRVGVGARSSPTPAGEFYIRDRITRFHDPFYGPIAFGTNGRSATLTDWPGGGFIGVHGTDAPDLIPGAVSHGCIRMRNAAIVRLARLMPVGTPLTIT